MQPNEALKAYLAEQAVLRYNENADAIRRIKEGVYQNRKGTRQLTEITQEQDKMDKRIAREGLPYNQAIERINGVPNFQDVYIIEKIMRLSRAVCRVNIASDFGVSGYGSGFLIAPGFIITNHHVIDSIQTAQASFAQFNYQLSESKKALSPVSFCLRPDLFFLTSSLEKNEDPFSGLDFTVVALESVSKEGHSVSDIEYARLDENVGKIIEGENCVIIQHPAGDYKKIVLKDIRMLTLIDDFMVYESDTLPGSSGSVVIGMGTGEVVALHHSGVPRKDATGRWLKKDGTPAGPDDSDNEIDWLGNEGIRVSSILRAIRNIVLPAEMEPARQKLLEASSLKFPEGAETKPEQSNMKKETSPSAGSPLPQRLFFEVELAGDDPLLDDFEKNAAVYIAGLKLKERLFPYSSLPRQRNMWYLEVQTAEDPWALAARIEALPHVLTCTPDLPTVTDVGISGVNKERAVTESAVKDFFYNEGIATWNENEFSQKWSESVCYKKALGIRKDYYRQWNWVAVNCPQIKNDTQWADIEKNLKLLRLTQLDTGYSNHSKVKSGYDFTLDMDFIDNDTDALDEQAKFLFKFPNHGTRTASIVIGGAFTSDAFPHDGNRGILTLDDKPLIRLIPYRVAKSVVLIGRGRDMVAAANHAINNKTDVMFICMGSYPRPMIEEVARTAYEKGVIWVCAAGNEVEMVVAPALYPGTIAVAGINPDLKPWQGSSNGPAVDIAAPGESVYVPFSDKDGNEIMCYGNGTSYATPHVASAAMLWKAKHREKIAAKYKEPWQVVEAFRFCLKKTADTPEDWNGNNYGAGILNIGKLLELEPPEPGQLLYAYAGKGSTKTAGLGLRETIHFLWNTWKRKTTGGPEERTASPIALTENVRINLAALSKRSVNGLETESTGMVTDFQRKEILSKYFESQE